MPLSKYIDIRGSIPQVRDYRAMIDPRIGAAVRDLIANHLFEKDAEGNKNGWPSQHFYAACAKSCSWHLVADGVVVNIAHLGFLQRLLGGTIKALNAKYLTIPARSEAYWKRAGEFGNLEIRFGKRADGSIGPNALVAGTGGATRRIFQGREGTGKEHAVRGAREGVVMFWLVKEVTQAPDPSIMPTDQEILDAAIQTAVESMELFNARNGGARAVVP
jgi:hypothetical protein